MTVHSTDPVGGWLERFASSTPEAHVVDVGGGSGTRAVPLAQRGCTVLVVDASTDALASLARRAAEAGVSDRVSGLQGDADQVAAMLPAGSADLVLYHHVVQAVDDPARALAAAAAVLRPGGRISVLVAGRLSAVLGHALAGRFGAAAAMLAGDPGLDRRYDVPALRTLLERAGFTVESITGIGVVTGLAAATGRAVSADEPALAELEQAMGTHPVLGQVAGDLHAVGTTPAR
ncbi:MAG TPA: methyltransferase domain-containing protein [Nakamurella sp.]|nr:methyltransferase domain-containing protein [Nakamurella sp.]